MHLVSSEGVTGAAQQTLFMPMMTRMPKARVKMLVISLSPNAVPGAVLRQNGVPVYDVALSKSRFSTSAFGQLIKTMHAFRPDVIQAWGHTAEIVSTWLQKRSEWEVKVVWSISGTLPLGRKPGLIDRQKLKYAAKFSKRAHGIVYTSEAAASAHRRVGFPESGHTVIPLGVDPTRFKPDFASRRKVREQLGLAHDAFVIGMMAPFQPEYDHPTLLKAVGEIIKTNPHVSVLLAGHGVQKGNAPLMALVGGGTLGTRTQLLGEWSDVSAFFNACDLACSSAMTDNARMSLVIAMLCGVPCVATGMGAQGEVIGQYGVAVEPGSPAALIRGITRVMQLTPDKRVFMAQGARKHALANFVSIRSLQKYLQLYYDLAGRKLTATTAVPMPEIDATIPTPSAEEQAAAKAAPKPKANRTVDMYELRDPDSLESRDLPAPEERAAKQAAEGDVLNIFESTLAKQAASSTSPMSERARGVADEHEDLLSPEIISGSVGSKPAPVAIAPSSTAAPIAKAAEPVVIPVAASAVGQSQALAIGTEEPKVVTPAPAPKIETSAKPAPAPQPAPEPAKIELSLADTMSFSMQISSTSTTGTLEIPPDLIFMPIAARAPKTAVAPAPVVETPPVVASLAEPIGITAPQTPVVDTTSNITADSSTVPAIAVDAILSSMADAIALPIESAEKEAIQLDLLGEPVDQKLVVG
jgi:glycosyltransferase involved in cell wall biosynthesis